MNVKKAIELMAANPAVDFAWEGTLIKLINGFLSAESQLDPNTAAALEIQQALDSLDAATQELVFTSNIGPASVASPLPAPVVTPKKTTIPNVLKYAGFAICGYALVKAAEIGDMKTVVELAKMFAPLFGVELPPTE